MPSAFRADHVVTGAGPVHSPGWIIAEGERIAAIGRGDAPTGVQTAELGRGSIVIPGLVSAHTHLALGRFRGVADDRPFLDWIMQGLLPAIREAGSDPEVYARGARASADELLRGGVTLVGDNFFGDDGTPALEANGQRGIFFQEVFGSTAPDEDSYWSKFEKTCEALEKSARATPYGYSPHTPWTCPPRTFRRVVDRASSEGRRLSFHLAESREEHELFMNGTGPIADHYRSLGTLDRYRPGMTPTAFVAELGALGPKTVVAHAVHVTPDDVALLARTQTGVVHCPGSNMKLAEGFAPVAAMLDAGVTVALGVDSAASSSRLDLFEEMRAALHVARASTGRVGSLTAATVLRMATLSGAQVLGFGDVAGSLERGKLADFVVLDASHGRHRPVRDPVATVVHTCAPEDVSQVVIGGVTRHRRRS
jgi:5-methylthioadenosine/S-adenosylhomocysteine deaminase